MRWVPTGRPTPGGADASAEGSPVGDGPLGTARPARAADWV